VESIPNVKTGNIPQELRDRDQWVLWRYKKRDGIDKPKKVPFQPGGRARADVSDPATWASFGQVLEELRGPRRYDGIGFVFSKDDPYFGADLDGTNPDDERAARFADGFDTYCERSPSGRGLHFIGRGEVPAGTKGPDGEIYCRGRYFTMTGDVVRDAPIRDAQDAAMDFYAWLRRNRPGFNGSAVKPGAPTSPPMEDAEVLELARRARNGADFETVYSGGGAFNSASERDLRLASMVAFWTQDPDQIIRIMRGSGCYRPKMDRQDYMRRTIDKALAELEATYSPGASEASQEASEEPPDRGDTPRRKADKEHKHLNMLYGWMHRYPDRAATMGALHAYRDGWWRRQSEAETRAEVHASILADAEHDPRARVVADVAQMAHHHLYVPEDRWDADPDIVVVENGTLEIGASPPVLRDHRKDDYALSALPIRYDPAAGAPRWHSDVLGRLQDGEAEFLKRFAGYALTTRTDHEIAVWISGESGSGKSTFVETVAALAGTRAGTLSLPKLQTSFGLSNIPGKTLLIATEQPSVYLEDSHLLDGLISGELLTIEVKYRPAFDYAPTAKLLWAMNTLPTVRNPEGGIFRRVRVLEWAPKLENEDTALKAHLRTHELPGVLNWALEGLAELREAGRFEVPETVKNATDEFKKNSDVLGLFLEERCHLGKGNRADRDTLYEVYKNWCALAGHRPQGLIAWARNLNRREGVKVVRSNNVRTVHGVALSASSAGKEPG
jgi:putative DNA primase/helicase